MTDKILVPTFLLLLTAVTRGEADTAVVVNFGPFPSAEIGGHAEATVDWLDGDKTDDNACTECFAALELQRHLRRITTRANDFAIVDDDKAPAGELILVGGPASNAVSRELGDRLGIGAKSLSDLGPEGYRIKSATVNGRRVTLVAGGSRVGTLYGSYDLLHRMGCRWFAPGETHEDVPHVQRIPDIDVTERPSFLTRGFHAGEDRGNPEFLLWMARNRLNYWCVEQSNHPLLLKLGIRMAGGGKHKVQWLFLDPHAAYPYKHSQFEEDKEKAKDPYPLSIHYQGDTNNDGKLSYFEAHPEWYAMIDGRRIPGIRAATDKLGRHWVTGKNYCTSNPHATTELMKNYVQSLIDGPEKDTGVARFWMVDASTGAWCTCPECTKLGTPTDRYLLLVHRLDREIKKARAAGKINRPIFLRWTIYHELMHPPTRPLPDKFDYATCSGTFFPSRRSYVGNINDPNCPQNAAYLRHVLGWVTDPQRYYRGQVCIGEYYNYSSYKCLPMCFMHTMANDIPYYYHKLNARHFHYMHVKVGDWGSDALKNYQMARLLWDVDGDCEALWKDYFARRYGPAAGTMRRFYESLEKMFCNVLELRNGFAPRLNSGAKNLFPTAYLRYQREPGVECQGPTLVEMVEYGKQCRQLIDQAMASELPERTRARIAEDERLFTYGERTIQYYDACVQAFQLARTGRLDEARDRYGEARRIADLLREDTVSASMACNSWANSPNAFVATRAEGALKHLAKLLAPVEPEGGKR